jgi:hypothetical protein
MARPFLTNSQKRHWLRFRSIRNKVGSLNSHGCARTADLEEMHMLCYFIILESMMYVPESEDFRSHVSEKLRKLAQIS